MPIGTSTATEEEEEEEEAAAEADEESPLQVLCLENNCLYGEPPLNLNRTYFPNLTEVRLSGNTWVDRALAKQRLRADLPLGCDLAV